jgi:hypothetical protein
MTTHTNWKHQAKPSFNAKRNDPEKYSKICPECSMRFGQPDVLGWIDIRICAPCVLTRAKKTKLARERGH